MSTSGPNNLAPPADRSRPVGSARVLVVEDEASLRALLIRAATEWGFNATPASSGETGARLNEAEPFDIAILDLMLPGMNGIETLTKLRQRAPNIQGIILTGSATVVAAKAAIHLGVVEFLTKPCNRGELEQALERARRRVSNPLPVVRSDEPQGAAAPGPSWDEVERQHILAAVDRNGGDRALSARELGISRKTLYNKLKEYLRQGFKIP
jgi:DNA-binding NtrC family response regulator